MHLVYFLHFWKLIVCFKNPSQVCLFVSNQYHARDSNGLGVFVRDSNGLIIASLVQKISYPGSVEMVKTLATRRAVILTTEIGTWKIEVEGDSEKIIKAINQWGPDFTPYRHIIEDIKRSAQKLQWSHFRHTRREGNDAAHALVRYAKHSTNIDVWMKTVPPDIGDGTHRDFLIIQ